MGRRLVWNGLGVAGLGILRNAVAQRARSKGAAGCCRVVLKAAAVAASFIARRGALRDGGPCAGLVRAALADGQPNSAIFANTTAPDPRVLLVAAILQGGIKVLRNV